MEAEDLTLIDTGARDPLMVSIRHPMDHTRETSAEKVHNHLAVRSGRL